MFVLPMQKVGRYVKAPALESGRYINPLIDLSRLYAPTRSRRNDDRYSEDVASCDKDTIFVPGRGQEGISLARNVFDDIVEQAEKMYQAGVSVSAAVDRYVIPEKFKSMPMWSWNFCIATAVTKLYGEWGAKKKLISTTDHCIA
jgi:hypothetical protein